MNSGVKVVFCPIEEYNEFKVCLIVNTGFMGSFSEMASPK